MRTERERERERESERERERERESARDRESNYIIRVCACVHMFLRYMEPMACFLTPGKG